MQDTAYPNFDSNVEVINSGVFQTPESYDQQPSYGAMLEGYMKPPFTGPGKKTGRIFRVAGLFRGFVRRPGTARAPRAHMWALNTGGGPNEIESTIRVLTDCVAAPFSGRTSFPSTRTRSEKKKGAVTFSGWGIFLVPSSSPHVCPMRALNTCGEPDETELTIRVLTGDFTALFFFHRSF